MRSVLVRTSLLPAVLGALALGAHAAAAQDSAMQDAQSRIAAEDTRPHGLVTREELIESRLRKLGIDNPDPAPRRPTSREDSLEWVRARRAAVNAKGLRVVVSRFDRKLWLIKGSDTLYTAKVGVGMGVVTKGSNSYDFSTPRGRRVVLEKAENPLWIPPDWHYYGQAKRVRQLPDGGVKLSDGSRVAVRGDSIGIRHADGSWETLPADRPLMFEGTLYIPPFGTVNRQIPDVLGKYKLDLGDGYMIHGTNDPLAVGFWATHGCVRLFDDDIEFVYNHVPVGTPVYIY